MVTDNRICDKCKHGTCLYHGSRFICYCDLGYIGTYCAQWAGNSTTSEENDEDGIGVGNIVGIVTEKTYQSGFWPERNGYACHQRGGHISFFPEGQWLFWSGPGGLYHFDRLQYIAKFCKW